jgi:hypothetical protein
VAVKTCRGQCSVHMPVNTPRKCGGHKSSKSRAHNALIGNSSPLSNSTRYTVNLHTPCTTSFTASSKILIPLAKSSEEMLSGGMNRTVSYTDVVSRSMPFSRHRFDIFEAKFALASFLTAGSNVECDGEANSTAIIRPCPRTSRMCCPTVGSAFSALNAFNSSTDLNISKSFSLALGSEKYRPHLALTLSRIFSSLNASATAMAAAHDTAFPAYVPPYVTSLESRSGDEVVSVPSSRA